MRSKSLYLTLASISVLWTATSLRAQTPGYRLEIRDPRGGPIALVNDSTKTIEAYHFSAHCANTGVGFSYDVLDAGDGPGSPDSQLASEELRQQQRSENLRPGEERIFSPLKTQSSGCTWDGLVGAVIYDDGTFEGDPTTVRTLQGKREGRAAALRFWMGKFHRKTTDNADMIILVEEAKRLAASDLEHHPDRGCPNSIECSYWIGRWLVDADVALQNNSKLIQSVTYKQLSAFIERWQKKVDDDLALKILEGVFPIPASVAAPAPGTTNPLEPQS